MQSLDLADRAYVLERWPPRDAGGGGHPAARPGPAPHLFGVMTNMDLRAALRERQIIAPGVYDALTASVAAASGFEALYLSGGAIAYTKLGRPDTRAGRHHQRSRRDYPTE